MLTSMIWRATSWLGRTAGKSSWLGGLAVAKAGDAPCPLDSRADACKRAFEKISLRGVEL